MDTVNRKSDTKFVLQGGAGSAVRKLRLYGTTYSEWSDYKEPTAIDLKKEP